MLTCIAVDDEPLALQLMEDYISKVPYLQLVATCGDAFDATSVLQERPIDLVFIDIQMPGLTGLQFIQSLTHKPLFILITAYEKFALQGYALNVVDYLLKPVDLSRFLQACNKALELHNLRQAASQQPAPEADFFFVTVDYSQVKLMYADLVWIEGLRDYVKIHLKPPAKPLIVRSSVKHMEEELPATRFLRFHKSYIAAIDAISSIRRNSLFIGELELPIGETYRERIEKLTKKNW
ncbi:MAG: response regulator transcription factor [Candidatus Pseudobacter hemicellulosilyticus]|uniref:Response regulator transcription factor n=1 Tax=Candidatus Pseudobacter hemicellulosilyticus TaxID=3121375 RepID=A0AAJ5WN11_9BACT|nr:MAG: response regulator transcription factor [Pseudobacter sp.]